jgi:hypothetical protein
MPADTLVTTLATGAWPFILPILFGVALFAFCEWSSGGRR